MKEKDREAYLQRHLGSNGLQPNQVKKELNQIDKAYAGMFGGVKFSVLEDNDGVYIN